LRETQEKPLSNQLDKTSKSPDLSAIGSKQGGAGYLSEQIK